MNKGKSIKALPDNFVVLDLETTGLDYQYDNIIEISALRIRSGEITETFSTLVNPGCSIAPWISELTGITDEMLVTAPPLSDVIHDTRQFVADDIIIGHNVSFDVSFLCAACVKFSKAQLLNDYVDTMRIARRVEPGLKHYRLKDLVAIYNVKVDRAHRAEDDCIATLKCYYAMREKIEKDEPLSEFIKRWNSKYSKPVDLRSLSASGNDFDETHMLYGKHCCFTGTLEKMQRVDAAQMVINVGGFCDNGVNRETNFLILGNNDYCKSIKGGKSSKQKKAEEYAARGLDIQIITENVFYELMGL